MDREQLLDVLLSKVQESINEQLARQYEQLVDGLYDFLDDLFNYPLLEDWRISLARFSEHWADRGLILSPRTLAALEHLIAQRIGGSIAVALAEVSISTPSSRTVGTDAALSMAPDASPAPKADASVEAAAKRERGLRSAAKALAAAEQRRLQLTDDERLHFEFHTYENLRRGQLGWPLLPPPEYWLDKNYAYQQRIGAQPSIRALTKGQAEQSRKEAIRAGYGSPAEREKLARDELAEQKRKYRNEHGEIATFFNPAFAGTGNFTDLMMVLGNFGGRVGGMKPGAAQGGPLAARPRGRRGGPSPKPQKPPAPRKPAPVGKKPPFPPPAAKVRVTIRRGQTTPHPSHVLAAESEEVLSRFIHSLPDEAVLFWGQKIGAHGADAVSYNLRTRIVTLWDVKWRSAPVRIPPSKTFEKDSNPLKNAVRQAVDAVKASRLSEVHKAAAIQSIRD